VRNKDKGGNMKFVFIIGDEQDIKLKQTLEKIVSSKGVNITVYTINKELKDRFNFVSSNLEETIKFVIEKENPYLTILHKRKVDPFISIISEPEYIKITQLFKETNFLFLDEETTKIEKVGVIIDFIDELDFTEFLKQSFELSKILDGEPEFLFSFYEEYYEMALMKTHTEAEAKQIINDMKKEKIENIKSKLAVALDGKPANLKILSGNPKKRIPYYLHENKFDVAILSHYTKNLDNYLSNIEISIGII
jgi:hypothetical protein